MWETPLTPSDDAGERLKTLKEANKKLKAVSDKALIRMTRLFGRNSTYIPAGHCKLCAACSCRAGKACAREKDVRFSFESLGVHVSPITEKYFGTKLLWYRLGDDLKENGETALPPKTVVVGGFLTKEGPDPEFLTAGLSENAGV